MPTTLPTIDEIVAIGRASFRNALDPGGTGTVNLAAGSRNDTAISALAAIANRLMLYSLDRATAARIASATGDDLDEAAQDLFGERRNEAASATGFVRLTRPGTGATSIPLGSRFGVPAAANQPAISFQATQDVAVASADSSVVVTIECTEPGTTANGVTPALITAKLDSLPDNTWVLDTTYAATIGGGALRETDDEFKSRLFLTTPQTERQRGTKAAIDTGALRVPGCAFVTSIEPLDGTVIMYSGDSAFELPDVMRDAIYQELLAWRCFGVPVVQRPYNVQLVTVTASVYMAQDLSNYDQVAIAQDSVQRVSEYFENRARPDEYFRDAIIGAIFKAHSEIQHVVLAAPVADVTRPADSGYGTVTSLNRFRATESSIKITIFPPLTA